MPILQKRKVYFAEDSKTYGTKKIKFSENLADNSSSHSESKDETFKNKISSKGNKVSKITEDLKTCGTKKAKSGQIQKYTSSSESESENEAAKSETSPKEKKILKVSEVSKTYGMKKIKLGKNLADNSSSDSESEDETFKNKISSKENKVSKVTEDLKTCGMKKAKPGQSQKYTSSSESESEDETPKTKTSSKKQVILKNGSPKKRFDFSISLTKDKTLSADEGSKNSKESSSKSLELTRSDSDEPPLVIDEDGDNDLLGLQKYMKDELKLNVSSPTKAKLNHDVPQSMPDKNSNNVGSSSESESDIDVEGSQETTNANNCRQIKRNMNKKLNNASSESESDSEKIQKQDSEKDANIKENGNKNSSNVDSESDSDIEGTQKILKKKSYKKVADSPKKYNNENLNTVISQSESESDVEETQKPVKTKNDNKDVKTKSNTNKTSSITSESKSDSGEKKETKNTKNFKKVDLKVKKVINQVSKVVTSDSESDEEETQETESKSEETNINLNDQSNLNTSETQFDAEETQIALKDERNSSKINYDVQMLSKTKKANNSDNSDFELTLEGGASHQEKEPASSDTDSRISKVSSDPIKKTSASRKKKLSLSRKAPSPVAEGIRQSDDLVPENELTLENGSSHEDKTLASTDTDLKKPAVVNGTLKRNKKKARASPRKAPLPVNEVKSENGLASRNDSSHEDEEQASSDTVARKSKTDAKLKKASASKRKRLNSPEKAPAPPAPPAVAEAKHELNNVEPNSEEDEISSDDSADDEEDLNESLLHSTQPAYRPTDEEKKKLGSIEIQIKHKVLPQHNVESTAGTRTMNKKERVKFEEHAILKRGTFDGSEDKQIKKNWKIFCKNHEWSPKNPKPFLFMKHKNKEALMSQANRKKFMQILAHGLPNRSLYSVFQRFKNLYDPHRTCRYTEDEDGVIVDFISTYNAVDEKDRKFAELAAILKRTRASVWRRYRVLKRKQLLRVDDALCHSSR